jgi:hypothetical protein
MDLNVFKKDGVSVTMLYAPKDWLSKEVSPEFKISSNRTFEEGEQAIRFYRLLKEESYKGFPAYMKCRSEKGSEG